MAARIKKRPRVGTILGTEDRNDDETIARTPAIDFSLGRPPPPTEVALTDAVSRSGSVVSSVPDIAGPPDSGEGHDNGKPGDTDTQDTPSDQGSSLGDEEDQAETETSPAPQAPGGTIGGLPSLPDTPAAPQSKDIFGEVAAAMNESSPTAPANAPSSAVAPGMSPDTREAFNESVDDYQSSRDAEDSAGGSTGGGSGGGGNDGASGPSGGGGTGGATGGEGPSGDSSGGGVGGTGTGGGAFDKGGTIKGKDPNVKGEIVTSTFKEGENVMNVPATTILSKEALNKVNRIALMKKLSEAEKRRRIKRTIVQAI